jgi:uncharacterized protein YbbC (DUF1343 family)
VSIRLGCERLFDDELPRVRDQRVGLITNHSGVDSRLRATADNLHAHPDIELVRLFGPEHGIRGDAEDGIVVDDAVDQRTGVPAVSLYGERRQPSADELAEIDVLLFDIQDVGVRFYTYLYTMSLGMEACAAAGVPFVVLDRPNPLGGVQVEGNLLDPAFSSFVGLFPIPIRYGLTIGELAHLFNEEYDIGADLHVVAMEGWQRSMDWRATGLPWVAPSPNMPTLDTAAVYPGMCYFEGTNVSEGRGTTRPFEQIGAPFIDGFAIAEALEKRQIPGAGWRPVNFRPAFSKHTNDVCRGVQVHIQDESQFAPVRAGFEALAAVCRLSEGFEWRANHKGIHNFDKLAGTDRIRQAIDDGIDIADLVDEWARERRPFEEMRERYLQYA